MAVAQPSDMRSYVSSINGTDDREACSKFWVAIYSRPNSEKKLAQELSQLGIETYFPVQTQIRQWSDRKKKVDVVIIPMIVFANITDGDIASIRTHPHVIRILAYPGQKKPAHIPAKQIERLKFMLDESEKPVEFIQGNINVSDLVRVIRGHLLGLEGVVDRTPDGKPFIIVTIDILGGAKVSVNPSDLELISTN